MDWVFSRGWSSNTSLKVRLKITGEFNGDLYASVRQGSGFTVLLNRPGKTASNPFGYADSGFDVTFQTGAANGDAHVYQNVTTPANGSPLTGAWEPDGRDVDPTNVTDLSTRATSLTNFNGLNAAGDWTLFLADVESGGTNMLTEWSLEISGAANPTLAWANPADIVYGTALGASQLNATAAYNSANVPGTFAYSPAAGTVLDAGLGQTLSVTFTPADPASFLPISTNVTLNVLKAPLTITANDTNKVYGAALPTFTASYSGFVNGDDASSLDTPVTFSTTATATSNTGSYPITLSGGSDTNYTLTLVAGTLTVLQAATTNVTLTTLPPGSGTPSGAVQFRLDSSPFGSPVILSNGAAAINLSTLAHGAHTIIAEYGGDSNFSGSTNSLSQLINTRPAAGTVTFSRPRDMIFNIRISELLTNVSDADGDAISLLSVSATSTNGATISTNAGHIFYVPPSASGNVTDSFNYTVMDTFGAVSSGMVVVTIAPDSNEPSVNLTGLTTLPNGSAQIGFAGIPGRSYLIQATTNLVPPITWTTLSTNVAGTNGLFQYIDLDATNFNARFYRTAQP